MNHGGRPKIIHHTILTAPATRVISATEKTGAMAEMSADTGRDQETEEEIVHDRGRGRKRDGIGAIRLRKIVENARTGAETE